MEGVFIRYLYSCRVFIGRFLCITKVGGGAWFKSTILPSLSSSATLLDPLDWDENAMPVDMLVS